MNIQLEEFEDVFDEDLLLEGELLFIEGAVENFEKFEDDLWVAEVNEGPEKPEVELLIEHQRLKKATCDCEYFHEADTCPHIIGCLFAFREHLSSRTEPKKDRSTSDKPRQLTTKGLLDTIDQETLKQFIAAYSRSDIQFFIALRLRFASAVDLEDNFEKYRRLIRQMKRRTVRSASLNKKRARQMFDWLDQLAKQARDALVKEVYTEAGWCYLAMIIELNPLYHKVIADQEKRLKQILDLVIGDLEGLLTHRKVPPALKDNLVNTTLDYLEEQSYIPSNPVNNLYVILLDNDPDLFKRFIEMIAEMIDTEHQSWHINRRQLSTMMNLCYLQDNTLQTIPSLSFSREKWMKAARLLHDTEAFVPWFFRLFKMEGESTIDVRIARLLMEDDRLSDHHSIALEVADYLLNGQNLEKTLSIIQKWPTPLKNKLFKHLENHLQKWNINERIQILQSLGKQDKADNLLRTELELDRFPDHKNLLLNMSEKELIEFIDEKIETYLKNHFGKPARQSIQNVLALLQKNNRSREASILVKRLNKRRGKNNTFALKKLSR